MKGRERQRERERQCVEDRVKERIFSVKGLKMSLKEGQQKKVNIVTCPADFGRTFCADDQLIICDIGPFQAFLDSHNLGYGHIFSSLQGHVAVEQCADLHRIAANWGNS